MRADRRTRRVGKAQGERDIGVESHRAAVTRAPIAVKAPRARLRSSLRRDCGMAPKQVLRRARALDMASHLRGVADDSEAEALALRYYDQSHLIRDFQHFLEQTPMQFVMNPQPIFTLSLEVRQARRLEELGRLGPGARRPRE